MKKFFSTKLLVFGALLLCVTMVLGVGVYAYNKQMPLWFGVYVSTSISTRLAIAVDDGEFYPFYDNKYTNENFTLYNKGLIRQKDVYYLPLTNLKSSTVLHLKVYNYSTEQALNASLSIYEENLGAELYSNNVENLMPASVPSTIETSPYGIIDFQVYVLYKNTPVTLQLNLLQDDYEPI